MVRRPRISAPGHRLSAFSLIEILVAVAILGIIMLGLLAMFYQTERAWRAGVTQVDVMESGRAVMEIISRDVQEMSAAGLRDVRNFNAVASVPTELVQPLAGGGKRTNRLQEFFLLTRINDQWKGVSYGFTSLDLSRGAGALHRMEWPPNTMSISASNLSWRLLNSTVNNDTNFHRLADGIIHLELKAYDRLGNAITGNQAIALGPIVGYEFFHTNLPASLELELGVVEPRTFDRFKSLAPRGLVTARAFLEERASRVHILRERIPIRTSP